MLHNGIPKSETPEGKQGVCRMAVCKGDLETYGIYSKAIFES